MKAGTLNHVKTKRLKRKLGIPLYQAAGILESLWQIATECADEGDIGKYPNADIADQLEWEKDPDELIEALVEIHWLDEHPTHRLIIHDWLDHAPSYIKERVTKRVQRKQRTCDDKTPDMSGRVGDLADQSALTHPIPSQPITSHSIPTQPGAANAAGPLPAPAENFPEDAQPKLAVFRAEDLPLPPSISTPEFLIAWTAWLKYRRGRRLTMRKETLEKQVEFLTTEGPLAAARMIDQSIQQGWQGLFLEKDKPNARKPSGAYGAGRPKAAGRSDF